MHADRGIASRERRPAVWTFSHDGTGSLRLPVQVRKPAAGGARAHTRRSIAVLWDWLCFWRPPCRLRRVIVNLTHTQTEAIEGVLWSYRGGWLTLREASALAPGQRPTRIDGDVVIHRTQVAYFQRLAAVAVEHVSARAA